MEDKANKSFETFFVLPKMNEKTKPESSGYETLSEDLRKKNHHNQVCDSI